MFPIQHFLNANADCTGSFINPITDICWSCLFPISIGDATIVSGANPDTSNPGSPIQVCPVTIGWRVGLAIGYWEPFATTDVTRSPYCLVNLGGIKLNIAYGAVDGATEAKGTGARGAFYEVHWYKYPLIYWLNLITSLGCLESGDYDIGYVSELDPQWDDDSLSFWLTQKIFYFQILSHNSHVLLTVLQPFMAVPLTNYFGAWVHKEQLTH